MTEFRDLGLGEPLLKTISEVGFEEPTPVQCEAIPILLQGRDLIAQAQTGTGKTAAFALPIIERLSGVADRGAPEALILTPTRELAVQVAQTVHQLGRQRNTDVLAVYGGQPIDRQLRALRHPVDVVVGTPGRVMDHMRRETLRLDRLRVLILDEADEMLDMGFLEDIEWILEHAPTDRQTGLFSATIPDRIANLARRHMREPARLMIEPEQVTVPQIEQYYTEVVPRGKREALARLLDVEVPTSAIIFCRTKREVDELTRALEAMGYPAEALHGDLSQAQRDRVMERFRAGQVELLVATDVAARGLDIENVSHVINYDIPLDPEGYVHRIGRTGRAGATGVAITLVTPRERGLLRAIERALGRSLERRGVPTLEEVAARERELLGESLAAIIQQSDLDAPRMVVDDLAAYYDPAEIASAAVSLLMRERGTSEDMEFTAELEQATEAGMTRLFMNLGRKDGIRPMDVVGAIANEARIPGKKIGQIEIFDRYTFVDVPEASANRVVQALGRTRLRGKPVRVEVARPSTKPDRRRAAARS